MRSRRALILVVPVLAIGLLTGCSQVSQFAGEAMGIDVDQACTTFDGAYTRYQRLLEQGDATADQIGTSRDEFVSTLEGLADDIGGQGGELIRENAQRLAESSNLRAPETIEAVEQIKQSVDVLCG